MVGATFTLIAVIVYFAIVAWIFLGGHEHEPLTGAQGTLWTLAVTAPLFFGLGLAIGAMSDDDE